MYQADLAKIGVTLNIQSMDTATWLAQVNGVQYNGLYVSGDSLGNYQPATPLGASPRLVAKQEQLRLQDRRVDATWSTPSAPRRTRPNRSSSTLRSTTT